MISINSIPNMGPRPNHWRFLDENYILHTDGTISAIARIKGYDIYMQDEDAAQGFMMNLRSVITEMPDNISLEFHLKRRKDLVSSNKYRTKKLVRANQVLTSLRESYIKHIENSCYVNSIYLLIQYHSKASLGDLVGLINPASLEKIYAKSISHRDKLEKYCKQLQHKLIGCKLLEKLDATKFLYDAVHHRECEVMPDEHYALKDLLLPTGVERDGVFVMNGVNLKAGLLYFYPEPDIRLFTDIFSWLPTEMDVSFYLRRQNYGSLLRKSGAEEIKQERQVASADASGEKRLMDIAAWRRYVVNNNLQIFANVFFMKLYGATDTIEHYFNEINDNLASLGAIMESEKLLNFSIAYSIPGNMYRSKFMRHDHTEMAMCLLPATEFYQGNGHEEAVLGTNHSFTGFDLSNKSGGEFYHSMTIAKTGSGKGVLNCARVVQLYGLGYDFYTIEIGNTYEFLFKLLGGDYVTLDPDASVINPFPPYSDVGVSISSSLVSPTIKSLAKIFTDGKPELNIHQISVCEMALQHIYVKASSRRANKAPNLQDFYNCLAKFDEKMMNDKQKWARDEVLLNVKSFLDTIIGERFKCDNNLIIKDGLFGADFKRLKDDANLMMTYLTFLSLRFGQKALFQQTPSFITIDELHEFIRIDKETIRTLCSQIARMGRKERGYINLITQEADDISNLDSSLINQMHIVNLLYSEGNHDKLLTELSSLNNQAFNTWRNYESSYKNYRAAMVGFGDRWTDSFLTFPMEILALADTSSRGLQLKNSILHRTDAMHDAYDKLLKHYVHAA